MLPGLRRGKKNPGKTKSAPDAGRQADAFLKNVQDMRTISGLSEPGIKRQAYASAEKAKAAPDAGRLG